MGDRCEEKLEEEQEEILMKFLQMMPDSSQETILSQEDQELVVENEHIFFGRNIYCGQEEQGALTEGEEVSYISRDAGKKYREYTRKSQRETRNSLIKESGEEENDSGFATSSEQLLRVVPHENVKGDTKLEDIYEEVDSDLYSDSGDSCKTVESVSLLQGSMLVDQEENGENGGSCLNSAWNVRPFPFLPLCQEDMQVDEERVHSVDKSVQTVRSLSSTEDYIQESIDFISSVINMKYIVLSKKNAPTKKYTDLLKNANQAREVLATSFEESADEMDNEDWGFDFHEVEDFGSLGKFERNKGDIDPRETIITTNAEDIMVKSVESILVWLKNELKKNCRHFCNYWNDSVRADSVHMITEVVDLHSGLVRSRVSQFLIEIFDEIYELDSPVEDILLENKIAFFSCFRKSFLLSYDLIEHVSWKLSRFTRPRPSSKFQMVTLIKKSYFSLRLLKDLLESFLVHLQTEGFRSIFCRGPREEELNVLNLWERDCKRSDCSQETDGSGMVIKYINAMAQWSRRTEQVLSYCLMEVPLLSKPAHICSGLAQEIIFFQDEMLKRGQVISH